MAIVENITLRLAYKQHFRNLRDKGSNQIKGI